MTFPKKGTRSVAFVNEQFLWRVRPSRMEGWDAINIPIRHVSGGAILIAKLGHYHAPEIWPPITPALVKRCIALAIEGGWLFHEKGRNFELDASGLVS